MLEPKCCGGFAVRSLASRLRGNAAPSVFVLRMIVHLKGVSLGAVTVAGRLLVRLLRGVVHLKGVSLSAVVVMIDVVNLSPT
ncbi:MAG TPA: hypothetical protein VMU98_00195 [Acidimicrobiales bacterium]|nr:hypothetical protein [Acidimicrobiales bacterium]